MQLEASRRPRRAISLTPLIDVVFILLLFFMLTTQFSNRQGISISVLGDSAESLTMDIERLRINLQADGTVVVNNLPPIAIVSILDSPEVVSARDNALLAVVDSEEDVDLQAFTQLMDLLARMGFDNVAVQGLR